jgi:hypothetical protein
MSIEGEKQITDARRGDGIYDRLIANMDELHRRGLIFGASVTVTTENVREVSSDEFLKKLSDRGCKAGDLCGICPGDGREARSLPREMRSGHYLQSVDRKAPPGSSGNGLYLLPETKELRRLCGGGERLLPHQLSRRRGAVPVFALL